MKSLNKKKPKESSMTHKQPSVLLNKKSDTQPKELDWEMRLENILGNRKDIIDQLVGKIPDEKVIESLKYFDETKRQLDELISSLLTQQRTELLEEIKKMEMKVDTTFWEEHERAMPKGYNKALKDVTNLFNKKDE